MDLPQIPVSIFNKSSTFVSPNDWESSFDFVATRQWVSATRNSVICLALFYVVAVFSGQRFMKHREAFNVRNALTIWNSILAVLSTIGFCRILPEFIDQLSLGFHNSVCKWNPHNIVTAYWVYVLLLLKIVELGDTVFIVLRKQKLIFLQWYHHFSMVVSCWIWYEMYEPRMLWPIILNSFVHSVMYTYFGLRSAGVKIPRQYSMMLTAIQIIQMALSLFVNLYAFLMIWKGDEKSKCSATSQGLLIGFVLLIPFLYLFGKFFYDSYIRRSTPKDVKKKPVLTIK